MLTLVKFYVFFLSFSLKSIFISLSISHYLLPYYLFLRGRGPLKSTMDVIGAAKKISEAGANLDKFCKLVADQVLNLLFIYLIWNLNPLFFVLYPE